jgi:hypothetical protein
VFASRPYGGALPPHTHVLPEEQAAADEHWSYVHAPSPGGDAICPPMKGTQRPLTPAVHSESEVHARFKPASFVAPPSPWRPGARVVGQELGVGTWLVGTTGVHDAGCPVSFPASFPEASWPTWPASAAGSVGDVVVEPQ